MKGNLKILGTVQETFSLDSVVQVIILVYSLKKRNRELMTEVNLGQSRLCHVPESYFYQLYQNAQVNQDMKVLFVWSKKGAIPKNWITKLESKFAESEKNMNSL